MAWDDEREARLQQLVQRVQTLSPQECIEACKLSQELILARRGGILAPCSSDLIREMREERDLRNISEDRG